MIPDILQLKACHHAKQLKAFGLKAPEDLEQQRSNDESRLKREHSAGRIVQVAELYMLTELYMLAADYKLQICVSQVVLGSLYQLEGT